MKELIEIQGTLKAPKGQRNNFGNYNYRSCEDILEALKPLLKAHKCHVTLCDEMIALNERVYVRATAKIVNATGNEVTATAFAREADSKKGMDSSHS